MVEGINRPPSVDDLADAAKTPLESLTGKRITIDGRALTVGKLSINQIIALAKLLIHAAAKLTQEDRDQFRSIAQLASEDKAVSQEDLIAQLAVLVSIVDEDTVGRVLAVVAKQDPQWCGDHIGLADLAQMVEGIIEHNDLPLVKAIFFRQMRRFRPSQDSTKQ